MNPCLWGIRACECLSVLTKHVEADKELLLVSFTWPVRIKCKPVVGEKKLRRTYYRYKET